MCQRVTVCIHTYASARICVSARAFALLHVLVYVIRGACVRPHVPAYVNVYTGIVLHATTCLYIPPHTFICPRCLHIFLYVPICFLTPSYAFTRPRIPPHVPTYLHMSIYTHIGTPRIPLYTHVCPPYAPICPRMPPYTSTCACLHIHILTRTYTCL